MPVCAEFDLPSIPKFTGEMWIVTGGFTAEYETYLLKNRSHRQELLALLKIAEDAILNEIPKSQWHGVGRWARAMGQVV
jgi:hypothetical protein